MKIIVMLCLMMLIGGVFAHSLLNLKTGSMGTAFDKINPIEVKHAPYEKVKVGDVICFQPLARIAIKTMPYNIGINTWARNETGDYVCHRVVVFYYWNPHYAYEYQKPLHAEGEVKLMLTKGDKNNDIDEQFVDAWAYLGVVRNFR